MINGTGISSSELPRTFNKYFIGLCHRKWKTMYYNPWASLSAKLFVSCCRSSDMYNNFWAGMYNNLWAGEKTFIVESGIDYICHFKTDVATLGIGIKILFPFQDCQTSYEQQCSPSSQQQCRSVTEQECTTVNEQECNTVYEEQCTTVNEQQCSQITERVKTIVMISTQSAQLEYQFTV